MSTWTATVTFAKSPIAQVLEGKKNTEKNGKETKLNLFPYYRKRIHHVCVSLRHVEKRSQAFSNVYLSYVKESKKNLLISRVVSIRIRYV